MSFTGILSCANWRFYTDALIEAEYSASVLYSICIIVFISFFVVNLFVACVCYAYGRLCVNEAQVNPNANSNGVQAEMDSSQDKAGSILSVNDKAPDQEVAQWRQTLQDVFLSNAFEAILMTMIVLNMIILATFTRHMVSWHEIFYMVTLSNPQLMLPDTDRLFLRSPKLFSQFYFSLKWYSS